MTKVSVIVPAYNASEYIRKCLDSLVNQTLEDIEIIVVNDGSTDNTLDILKEYKDSIILIDQKNKGVATTRNIGISKAKGQYIAFVDSDDYVDKKMFEILYNEAISNDYDMVCCDFKYFDDNKVWDGVIDLKSNINNLEDKKKYFVNMFPVIWNKIYKAEKIKDIKFKDGVWAEDVEFLYRVIPNINTISKYIDNDYLLIEFDCTDCKKGSLKIENTKENKGKKVTIIIIVVIAVFTVITIIIFACSCIK